MKIVQIIPGTGGSFYCENCVRDGSMVKALRNAGHEVTMIPMYLPIMVEEPDLAGDTPIFFGAINVYLKQFAPFLKRMPAWLTRFFDSSFMLKFAASKAGSTRATGLEEMTLSMLRGEAGNQKEDLDLLISWLKEHGKPDVVYLANALLLGLARRIKAELKIPVVCALQDEDTWLDVMRPEYQEETWRIIQERAAEVDAFIAVSRYYADIMQPRMKIPENKMHIVHIGVNLNGYETSALPFNPPVIGFLSRLCEYYGLDILVDAFIKLKSDSRLKDLKLYITGGMTKDNQKYVHAFQKKLVKKGFLNDVKIFPEFDRISRLQFLKSLTVLSVPMRIGEAFGTFQIEAQAAGVPIIEPRIGAIPELLEITGGGILYEPNTPEALADALQSILLQPAKAHELGQKGQAAVFQHFSNDIMAQKLIKVFKTVI